MCVCVCVCMCVCLSVCVCVLTGDVEQTRACLPSPACTTSSECWSLLTLPASATTNIYRRDKDGVLPSKRNTVCVLERAYTLACVRFFSRMRMLLFLPPTFPSPQVPRFHAWTRHQGDLCVCLSVGCQVYDHATASFLEDKSCDITGVHSSLGQHTHACAHTRAHSPSRCSVTRDRCCVLLYWYHSA